MQWCVSFPQQDSLLILRASLKRACGGNKAAAAFLSYLLYQVSISQQYTRNAEQINRRKLACGEVADQLVTIDIYRSQKDIVQEMDGHLSDRTLRDTAIPLLVGLGYVEVDETEAINIYRVHLDAVQAGIDHPPSAAEVGARLRQLAGSGTFSARYQKAFLALAEVFPLPDGKTSVGNGKTSVGNGKSSAPLMDNQPASGAGASTERARGKKRKKKEERQEEVVAEAARVVRVERETQAAAAGCSDSDADSCLSTHDPAAGQRPVEQQEPTLPASASVTALSPCTPMPAQAQQEPEPARPGGCKSSPTTRVEPYGSTPTSAPPQHPVPPALFGAQAQAAAAPAPAKDEPLSPEAMVALVERLLGVGYDAAARARQLQAARQLLAMKLLPDLATLSRLYALCYDDWWRQHYGLLHLTHLVERETSGQPRILRLLARLTPAPVPAWTPAAAAAAAPSSVSFAGRAAVGSQSRQSGEEANAWLKRNQ